MMLIFRRVFLSAYSVKLVEVDDTVGSQHWALNCSSKLMIHLERTQTTQTLCAQLFCYVEPREYLGIQYIYKSAFN